jgi:hypothetical protein
MSVTRSSLFYLLPHSESFEPSRRAAQAFRLSGAAGIRHTTSMHHNVCYGGVLRILAVVGDERCLVGFQR